MDISPEMQEAIQKVMIKEGEKIAEELGVSFEAGVGIFCLRTRAHYTYALEKQLLQAYKNGPVKIEEWLGTNN